MSSPPEVDLEQQKVSSVDWNKVSSGNFFSDEELSPKDLESTEAIEYLRKVLGVCSMQMGGMTIVSLLCCFFNVLRALIGNSVVLYLSLFATLAFFVIMHLKEDLRKDEPMNKTYLLTGSICMIVCYGALSGIIKIAAIVTFIMAVSCAILGLYLGVRLAKTSINREYLIRKLLVGAAAGFLVCIVLMVYAMSAFRFHGKSTTFVFTMIIYLLAVTYLGYVLVFVILPGQAQNKGDYIWGVLRMYMHIGIVIITLLIILAMLIKKKAKGEPSSDPENDSD